ncbi:MAG TPA: CDP-alcohol phosphatidyltransferase family protein [Steroidobacteraceae bacterium]|nr:CDP-alcohol phosphatidyltransferase family protein [Steroidobacteraceae bacterium]
MFDVWMRPLINPPLDAAARLLARSPMTANAVTIVGAAVGTAAGIAIARQRFGAALLLIALNRILDGLDGALARRRGPTDFGGYLDSVADYIFYAAVPLGFAVASPANALPAAALLASFLLSGSSFLAFAALAAKRRLTSDAHGPKSFFYLRGLAEGTETIAVFVLAVLRPDWFAALAYGFAVLCALTALQRLLAARRLLR